MKEQHEHVCNPMRRAYKKRTFFKGAKSYQDLGSEFEMESEEKGLWFTLVRHFFKFLLKNTHTLQAGLNEGVEI